MQLDPQMMAMLLQQAGQYRNANQPQQAPQVALGNQTVPSAAPKRSLFIDPRTAVQPGMAPPQGGGMMAPSNQPSMNAPGMGMQQGQQGQVDLASLLAQAQQYRQTRPQRQRQAGGVTLPQMGNSGNNAGMVSALRRSAMGEY